ncbi:VanZ family protein [Clostridium tyrobutyricum]|uniref:VanZ family protein n=1 Tax=Clostridium tyrobutyricum TaxID=1519 RepID=UPI001C385600|nr:VanZ family protein [Clostridium tyrobutyricum]MBV4428366.1 VanZ family protein [Clostridium tyrobutyricum]MBV4443427.1 VanZ family protein [Clostridium tyrobutyricum]
MRSLIISIISIFLVAILNIILKKNSSKLGKKLLWQHYLFGYLLLLYLMINLVLVVGVPSWFEWKLSLKLGQPIFHTNNMNLVPFKDALDTTIIFNIILFIPFGLLLPILWDKYRKLLPTFCYGFIFSLIIEVSQLFTRNRTCDINDLIFNTLGTVCGWLIFNGLGKIFYKLANKTVVNRDTSISKLEPHLYIVIGFVYAFFAQ